MGGLAGCGSETDPCYVVPSGDPVNITCTVEAPCVVETPLAQSGVLWGALVLVLLTATFVASLRRR